MVLIVVTWQDVSGEKTNSKAHSKGRDICAMCLARKTSENEAKEMVCIGRANPPHQVL